jgi:Tfp pilus assembly protein PilX
MQRGTTLAVGLMLLALVTLLGLAGASAARVEYRLALNERFRENAASAASAGIELFQRRLMNSTPDAAPTTLRGTVPGTSDEFDVQSRFAGLELSLPQAAGANLAGAHFDVLSVGRSAAGATDRQRAAVMLVIDSPEPITALDCAPLAPRACHERGRVERLAWHRMFEP